MLVRWSVRWTLPQTRRLQHDLEYQAVYGARMKKQRGPLVAFVGASERPYWRVGLAVGKRVGGAVERNRIKRALREAFRLVRHQLPCGASGCGCDVVLSAYPHDALSAAEYQSLVLELATLAQRDLERRASRTSDGEKA
jgi:ribonuclease P protein component